METRKENSIYTHIENALKRAEAVRDAKNGIIGVPSGFVEIDARTQGWQPSEFIIIAGRPGMGTTSFAMNFAINASDIFKQEVLFFSLDFSAIHLTSRILFNRTGISPEKIRKAQLEPHEFEELKIKTEGFANSPLYINDTLFFSVEDLCKRARKLKASHDIKLIVIDKLQALDIGVNNENIKHICQKLKKLANELQIAVIANSELPKSVEQRKGRMRPKESDLKKIGIPTHIIDTILFLYKPSYYGIDITEYGIPADGIEVIFSKIRNRSIGIEVLDYANRGMQFSNLPRELYEEYILQTWY